MRGPWRLTARAAACLLLALCAACAPEAPPEVDPRTLAWPALVDAARGSELRMAMWTGDPAINRYMQQFIAPRLRERYGITLSIVPVAGDVPVLLGNELAAGQTRSHLDLVWINGENFYKLRAQQALFGPFTEYLPGNAYVDWRNPRIARDFQQDVAGFEAPWGTAQLLLITDTARVSAPPRDVTALAAWIHAQPGRFTFDLSFTGLSFLKSLMIGLSDERGALDGPFDEARYGAARERLFAWLRDVQPSLWRAGKTFPRDVAQLHALFANGEVDFTMSMNDGEADNKVASGLFPPSAQAYALDSGTIANTHYLGIVARSPHKAAAMVVINELQSPEAQYEKLRSGVWGDGTVLDVERLPPPWPTRFATLPGRERAPPRAALKGRALAEPSPEVMVHLERDFREHFLGH